MNYKVLLTLCIPFASWAAADYTEQDAMRVQAVKTYIDNVLQEGRSQIKTTPLLADGINTTTRKPVEWIYPDGRTATISNFANQQNFLRTLTAMSVVTEDQRYQLEAVRITRYFMDNFIADNGLFYWGGHRFVNLDTLELEGPQNKNSVHELKNHYPYYPFLYHVDPHATERYIKAFWQAHVEDWQSLDMGRHGSYSKNYDDKVFHRPIPASLVDQSKLPIMPETKGLTFINAGSDLIYAAYQLDWLAPSANAQGSAAWGQYLMTQYKLAKHPKTGAPVYQFTSPKKREWPPQSDKDTNSKYGDRAARQFGPELGDIAREGNVLFKSNDKSIVFNNALIELHLAEQRNDATIREQVVDALLNFYRLAYNPENGTIKPIFSDGTSIEGIPLARDGYYGPKGRVFNAHKPKTEEYLLPILRAYRLQADPELWQLAANMTHHYGWGSLGNDAKAKPTLNMQLSSVSPMTLFSAIELYQITQQPEYLEFARAAADKLVAKRFVRGYFLANPRYLNASIDAIEPLALLTLDATLKGKTAQVAPYLSGSGYIHGEFAGKENAYDTNEIYKQTR
ncbi:TPA: exopolygalacturonate lyase [Vibrio vulnificus]|uniref:exopolygalacturonate lyase n=1 Tax=Vibrio vulnificus TaxID=672 RepID=UPI0019D41F90|nr:exopolygalacturonate lyase [Vibrio vulnificus]MBN8144466.1 exopolygalacturonate lyase [Vibrio vulnificus]HAS6159428.1 exopolygalacturonate lyase [Vibrio vulnificus]HDY7861030.1 exopolygalacturonate lyase [Vibrio vulnificus]HDY7874893.1 exopolygalacturonate lyase [Vibrio vulnificus]